MTGVPGFGIRGSGARQVRALALAILALIAASFMLSGMVSASSTPPPTAMADEVRVTLAGPTTLGHQETQGYTITVAGGPGAYGGNFSFKAYWKESTTYDLSGASPRQSAPATGNATVGRFTIDVTAPDWLGTFAFVVEGTSRLGNSTMSGQKETDITVIRPIYLKATIRNKGDADVKNLTVKFYVDDQLVGTRSITTLGAGANETLQVNWTASGIAVGAHRFKVWIDPEYKQIEVDVGNNAAELVFYVYGPEPSYYNWVMGIAVFVCAFVVVLTIGYGRKPKEPTLDKR